MSSTARLPRGRRRLDQVAVAAAESRDEGWTDLGTTPSCCRCTHPQPQGSGYKEGNTRSGGGHSFHL